MLEFDDGNDDNESSSLSSFSEAVVEESVCFCGFKRRVLTRC